MKVYLVPAARPNFMNIAPLFNELTRHDWCEPRIVHTGQHYDSNMSDAFFRAAAVVTHWGRVQEEPTALGIPCKALRGKAGSAATRWAAGGRRHFVEGSGE